MSHPPVNNDQRPARITKRQLEALAEVLLQVLSFRYPADQVISRYFKAHKQLGGGDRRFIAETVYTGLRHYYWVKALLAGETQPMRFALATLLGPLGFSVKSLTQLLSPQELQWAKEAKTRKPSDELWVKAELPPWIVSILQQRLSDEEILTLGRALKSSAALDIRVNTLKTDRETVLQQLNDEGIKATPTPYSNAGIRLAEKPALQRHQLMLNGAIEVQDEGSQLISLLLDPQPGEWVVDFCAGAGGKTLHLGGLMKGRGRIDAYDVSNRRLQSMTPRLARSGLSNIRAQLIKDEHDPLLKKRLGKADRVLVDAPCTGLGTLRRNPDLKFRQSQASLEKLTLSQSSILQSAARIVKPGGRLVYATCSLLDAENQQIVDQFLEQNPDFKRMAVGDIMRSKGIELEMGDDLILSPQQHHCDGFYAAVLIRQL